MADHHGRQLSLPLEEEAPYLYTYKGRIQEVDDVPIKVFPPTPCVPSSPAILSVTAWPTSRNERFQCFSLSDF